MTNVSITNCAGMYGLDYSFGGYVLDNRTLMRKLWKTRKGAENYAKKHGLRIIDRIEKVRDAKGYAYLLDNIERFGDEVIVVRIGGRTVYFGSASKLLEADKFTSEHEYTLCTHVYEDDGFVTVEA